MSKKKAFKGKETEDGYTIIPIRLFPLCHNYTEVKILRFCSPSESLSSFPRVMDLSQCHFQEETDRLMTPSPLPSIQELVQETHHPIND